MLRSPKVMGRRTCPNGVVELLVTPEKGLGRLKLIVWHLKAVERLDGQDVKPCAAVDEGLGDLYVADDG